MNRIIHSPFHRPRAIEEQCVTVSDQCENRRDSNHPTKNGTQDKVTALGSPASPARGEEEVSVDHIGSAGSKGGMTAGTSDSLSRTNGAAVRVEAGQEMEDGLVLLDSKAGPVREAVDVSECGNSKVAGGNTSGCDVVKGDHSSCHERGHHAASTCTQRTEMTSPTLDVGVLSHDVEASKDKAMYV